ncbi:sugar ABC transporter substrate-binding protein [Lacisediminihabitans sp.]|jgi:simple sugar transport system substrate-binding protein|uniref:sugar ABC transporter substrate-binding protein n=1 Tax=Lacisediminihabitans sp. TaxID=2787631 RepID=UPI002F94803C
MVTHGGPGDTFWDVVKSGAKQAGKDLGVTVTYQGDGDPVKQSQLIDAAIATHPDGLIVSMANPDGVKAAIAKAVAAGIPVITINSGLEQSKAFGAETHVGQSELIAGQGAGEKLAKSGVKKVICIIHEAGNSGLEDRCKGAADKLGGTVSNVQVDVANLADAQNTIKSKLLADPSIDGVLTLNPGVAVAASQAITEASSKAKLATFDVSADVTKLIEQGKILFAVDQQPYSQGYLPVVFLTLQKRNGDVVGGGQPVYSGPGFVTKDNAAQVAKFAKNGTR